MAWFTKTCLRVLHVMFLIIWITNSNMALYIHDQHILYYHMDAYWSIMMWQSYFLHPNYLVVQRWIRATLIYPTNIILAGPNLHCFFKPFPGVVQYFHSGNTTVPCHHSVAVKDILNHLLRLFQFLRSKIMLVLIVMLIRLSIGYNLNNTRHQ